MPRTRIDAVTSEAMLATIFPSFNGFHAILDNVRQSLSKLAPVAHHAHTAFVLSNPSTKPEDQRGVVEFEEGLSRSSRPDQLIGVLERAGYDVPAQPVPVEVGAVDELHAASATLRVAGS